LVYICCNKTLDKEGNTIKQVMTEQGNNLYSDSSKALSKLINLEIELNGSEVASAIRVAGKTMQGIMSNTSIQDMVQEYKKTTESELFKTLKQDPYSKDNFELELLGAIPDIAPKDLLSRIDVYSFLATIVSVIEANETVYICTSNRNNYAEITYSTDFGQYIFTNILDECNGEYYEEPRTDETDTSGVPEPFHI